eukprot:338763-Prymnesium_polylepis.1
MGLGRGQPDAVCARTLSVHPKKSAPRTRTGREAAATSAVCVLRLAAQAVAKIPSLDAPEQSALCQMPHTAGRFGGQDQHPDTHPARQLPGIPPAYKCSNLEDEYE